MLGREPGSRNSAQDQTGVTTRNYILALAALFLFEGLVFYSQYAEQIAPYYLRGFDQIGFFSSSYRLLNQFFNQGWAAFFRSLVAGDSATGITFSLQGAFLSLIGGPNRTAMISLNLLYFIGLQGMLFFTVLSKTSRASMAFIAVALLLATKSLFFFAGDLFDYRIDFCAMCLYGIWVCTVLLSDSFLNTRWSLVAGAVGSLLILMRFITLSYAGTLTFVLFVIFLVQARQGKPLARQRALNAFLCGATMLAVTAPFLFVARNAIYSYYGVGHVFGVEKGIRAAELGLTSKLDHILFYARSIWRDHLGAKFCYMAGILLLAALLQGSIRQLKFRKLGFDLGFLLLAALFPIAILTLDTSKSPVVGNITLVPLILLVVLLSTKIQETLRFGRTLAVASLAAGMFFFVTSANSAKHYLQRNDLIEINRLNSAIADYILSTQLESAHASFDRVSEFMNAGTIWMEVLRKSDLRSKLPEPTTFELGAIFALSRDEALSLLERSDIVVLTSQFEDRSYPYPFNASMREHWPALEAYAKANLSVLDSGYINGIPYRVYVRPRAQAVKISGAQSDWITSDGITIKYAPKALPKFSRVLLEGQARYDWLGGVPKPSAATNSGKILPVEFQRTGNSYSIIVDVAGSPPEDDMIKLTFDRFFVPAKIGLNRDARELVIMTPKIQRMIQ